MVKLYTFKDREKISAEINHANEGSRKDWEK